MSSSTTNYNLVKPTQGENYNVDISNSNMDILDSAIKEIADNIPQPGESVIQTKEDIVFYVATTGSDTTGNGTSGLPFKTIQFAINKLPQIINHNIIINVTTGTFLENLLINGFLGKGSMVIKGNTIVSTTHNVTNINVLNCGIDITITGFNITTTATDALTIKGCKFVYIDHINIVGVVLKPGIVINNSKARLTANVISGKQIAIAVGELSTVISWGNSGNGNSYGLSSSEASTIAKVNDQPNGTTAETTDTGGIIR